MTKAEAINELQKCKWLEQACRNVGGEYWEDLRQDLWVRLLTRPEEVYQGIRNLQFFTIRTLINLNTDKHRQSKKTVEIFSDPAETPEYHPDPDAYILKDKILGRLPFFERGLYKLHEEGMSCRAIAKHTKIDRKEVTQTINKVKQILKNVKVYTSAY